jgi:hypothetical protein
MDVETLLAMAQSSAVPSDWHVWRLRRAQLLRQMMNWTGTSAVGFAALTFALTAMIPDNFRDGFLKTFASRVVLGAFAMVAVGGLAYVIYGARRLRGVGHYLLVMTPDDFVKVEPRRITHVPMADVADVTLKGVVTPESLEAEFGDLPAGRRNWVARAQFGALSALRRRPKQQPSLAFRDRRTNGVVVVATDNAFDELVALEEVLASLSYAKRRATMYPRPGTPAAS